MRYLFILFIFGFQMSLWGAFLFEGQLDVTIERLNLDPLHVQMSKDSFFPVQLFYFEDKLETKKNAEFIEIDVQDIQKISIFQHEQNVHALVQTDEGGMLWGFLNPAHSLLLGILSAATQFSNLKQVEFKSESSDQKDSKNYMLEFSKEMLWKDVRVGDFLTYPEFTQKVVSIAKDSAKIAFYEAPDAAPKMIDIDFKAYPNFKISKVIGFQKERIDSLLITELGEKKSVSFWGISVEIENSLKNKKIFLNHALFPLAYFKGLNGVIVGEAIEDETIQFPRAVNRLRFDPQKAALEAATQEQKQELMDLLLTQVPNVFDMLKERKLSYENIDRFVWVDELYIAVDGMPQSFSDVATLEEKILETEAKIDAEYSNLDFEIEKLQMKLSELETEIQDIQEDPQKLYQLHETKQRVSEKLKDLLFQKNETSAAQVKEVERQRLERDYANLHQDRCRVVSDKIYGAIDSYFPRQMTTDDLMQLGKFELLSINRAKVSWPNTRPQLFLKKDQENWKLTAIVR